MLLSRNDNLAIETLQAWISSNRLRPNPTKTQFIWFGTHQQLAKIDLGFLVIKYPHFTFSSSVRHLEVTIGHAGAYIYPAYKSSLPQLLLPTSAHQLPLPLSSCCLYTLFMQLGYLASIAVAPYTKELPTCRLKCLDKVLQTVSGPFPPEI